LSSFKIFLLQSSSSRTSNQKQALVYPFHPFPVAHATDRWIYRLVPILGEGEKAVIHLKKQKNEQERK
jgi:hypothetical protein